MPSHLLTGFEIQKHYQNEPIFYGVYLNSFPKLKDGACVINLDEYESIETHWISLYVIGNNIIYFGVEHIAKEIEKFIGNKHIITNIYRIQAYDSVMRGYFCVGFINVMLKVKSLLDYTNLFSPNIYEKNDEIILKYFQ